MYEYSCRDVESCLDILGFHHVSIRCHTCHTRAYPLFVEIVWSLLDCAYGPSRDVEPCFDRLGFHHISIGWHTCHTWAYPLSVRIIWSLFVSAYNPNLDDE